jgi:hypothetical protein
VRAPAPASHFPFQRWELRCAPQGPTNRIAVCVALRFGVADWVARDEPPPPPPCATTTTTTTTTRRWVADRGKGKATRQRAGLAWHRDDAGGSGNEKNPRDGRGSEARTQHNSAHARTHTTTRDHRDGRCACAPPRARSLYVSCLSPAAYTYSHRGIYSKLEHLPGSGSRQLAMDASSRYEPPIAPPPPPPSRGNKTSDAGRLAHRHGVPQLLFSGGGGGGGTWRTVLHASIGDIRVHAHDCRRKTPLPMGGFLFFFFYTCPYSIATGAARACMHGSSGGSVNGDDGRTDGRTGVTLLGRQKAWKRG